MDISKALKCTECGKYIVTWDDLKGGFCCSKKCYDKRRYRIKKRQKKEEEKWKEILQHNIS